MSQVATLEIVVVGMVGLVQAIVDTGLEYQKQKKFQTDEGTTHDVDLVVTDEHGVQVGVKVDPKTEEAKFLPYDCKGTRGKAVAKRIAQRWAYSRVVDELKRKGYEVGSEEKQPDGTIKLVASKWR